MIPTVTNNRHDTYRHKQQTWYLPSQTTDMTPTVTNNRHDTYRHKQQIYQRITSTLIINAGLPTARAKDHWFANTLFLDTVFLRMFKWHWTWSCKTV